MRDLSLYRPVSNRPAIARDLSIAVADDDDVELLGDRVRDALGADADSVEAVEVLSETPVHELPALAAERLGLLPGQKNVLVRVVLRHAERTLTREEANTLRDDIYDAVHCGTVEVRQQPHPARPLAVGRPGHPPRASPNISRRMSDWHIREPNVARLRQPIDAPETADFVANLDPVNAMANAVPGFVWRLQDDSGNATSIHTNDDPHFIVNLSVWESIDTLEAFVRRSPHEKRSAAGVSGSNAPPRRTSRRGGSPPARSRPPTTRWSGCTICCARPLAEAFTFRERFDRP